MSVLQRVEVGVRSIAAYRGTAPDESLDELLAKGSRFGVPEYST